MLRDRGPAGRCHAEAGHGSIPRFLGPPARRAAVRISPAIHSQGDDPPGWGLLAHLHDRLVRQKDQNPWEESALWDRVAALVRTTESRSFRRLLIPKKLV